MKKLAIMLIAAVLAVAVSISAIAASTTPNVTSVKPVTGYTYGYCAGGANFMWDDNGNVLSREDAEAMLEQYVEDGYILESDVEYYLSMYDYCVSRGWDSLGCGFGRTARAGYRSGGCCRR